MPTKVETNPAPPEGVRWQCWAYPGIPDRDDMTPTPVRAAGWGNP